jgi:phosphopantothenoylcysteine decarboxylase/phosphopantothenate--cysteine ligase
LAIFAAAVADYTPQQPAPQKIKKASDTLTLTLTKTADIAQTLSAQKQARQRTVGFALETENELEYAAAKLQRKHLDMIVLNSLNDAGAGFGHDTNQVKILTQNMTEPIAFSLKDKRAVATDILDTIISTYYA